MKILSFYDVTGNAVRPWAEAGYECFCFDIQNDGLTVERFNSGGSINYQLADLHDDMTWERLLNQYRVNTDLGEFEYGDNVALVLGFPVCTDLAVSGPGHWARKREANPDFQDEAVHHARRIAEFADAIDAPYAIENPVSALASLWRKPNFYFNPFEYGG